MSEAENFDDFVKEEFKNYTPKVSPAIWERIADERDKRKPVAAWWSFSGSAVLIPAVILFLTGSLLFISNYYKPLKLQTVDQNKKIIAPANSIMTTISSNSKNISPSIYPNSESKKPDYFSLDKKYCNNKNIAAGSNSKNNDIDKDDLLSYNNQENNTANESTSPARVMQNNIANSFALLQKGSLLQSRVTHSLKVPECPTFYQNVLGNKRYIELYIGPDYGIRSLSDTANSAYLQKRAASTKFSSAFSAGIRYSRVFENGLSIHAGINYSQINEKFLLVQDNVIQTTYTIDPTTGDTTGSYTVNGTRYSTSYNHYRSIDIPVTFGYEFGNEKLYADVNAGPIINVYSWQTGTVLNSSYQPVDITTGKSSSSPYQFRTNVGIGLTGGVAIYYKMNSAMYVFGEPYFRYNFQPMSSSSLSLREKYSTVGLHLGVRFNLHNTNN